MREIPAPNVGAVQGQDQLICNVLSDAADSMAREELTTEGLLLGVRHMAQVPQTLVYTELTVLRKEALWLKEALQVCSNRDARKAAGNLAVNAFVLLPENRH